MISTQRITLVVIFIVSFAMNLFANDSTSLWHGVERSLRYHPEGNDIVIENGNRRFNRALYGGNTAFRAEAGDLPEFAMYMPGMGGNMHFGIIVNDRALWLKDAKNIKAIYRAGSMLYEIKDPLLGDGMLQLHAIALYDREGLMISVDARNIANNVNLVVVYGGATGKKFSRDGDIGADPESSFYLKPEYCNDNIYQLNKSSFSLMYGFSAALSEEERYEIQHQTTGKSSAGKPAKAKQIDGLFPSSSILQMADANQLSSPVTLLKSQFSKQPVIAAQRRLTANELLYFYVAPAQKVAPQYHELKSLFDKAEATRKSITGRVAVNTPDHFINTIGPALSIAADAIWESPSYMHGAIAWRMRLDGWRGAYIADVLGWHDRATKHFDGYAASQLTAPPTHGVVMDTALHLARHLEKIGTALFSQGYISRYPNDTTKAHHYDMNLVWIDQLLTHFDWTGDTSYLKKMWPVLKRHLAWEKRNFDSDGDGLYDSYAAIWASDALQYSGGGVTHSSSYNYRSNKLAAKFATLLGEDPAPYKAEADKIINAVNTTLWLKHKGWYAEFKDLLGNKLLHESPALWTIYHAIDEGIADPFMAYQTLNYVDDHIPHIPIKAAGLQDDLYTLSTSNWQPYTWSLNNVALAELLHTSLAYWQADRHDDAFKLWKSSLMESMYLGASPGNFQQLSFYDAIRGELYRDFADPIGMAGRTLIEGLFGIHPDAINNKLFIAPGFPASWDHASLHTPDIDFNFVRKEMNDVYSITPSFPKKLNTRLELPFAFDHIQTILVNGKEVAFDIIDLSVGTPKLFLDLPYADKYEVRILWMGKQISNTPFRMSVQPGEKKQIALAVDRILSVFDPQVALATYRITENNKLDIVFNDAAGKHSCFVQVMQGDAKYWLPLNLDIEDVSVTEDAAASNPVAGIQQPVALENYFNDKLVNIFKQEYFSPRPVGPTLQLPTQGIGNWAYPFIMPDIDDSGLRSKAAMGNLVTTGAVQFHVSADTNSNIVYTSQWDNYPNSVMIPLKGHASQLHLLMAGSTNSMQSQLVNGRVIVTFNDNTSDTLDLINPYNWCPIEQDYMDDGFAFKTGNNIQERCYLRTGIFGTKPSNYYSIKGFSNRGIPGGAANVLHMKLNPAKPLKSLKMEAVANDVIIGLMAATLEQ